MTDKTPAVYAAIAKAIQMAAGIALKWQDGAGGKTKGRKSEDLRRLMVKVLPQCGLVIIPGAVRLVERTNEKTSSGGSMFHHCIEQEFIIASTEDGSTVTGGSAGSGMDMGDKYTSKATTYAMKNFVLNLLQIPSEAMEDDEIYGQELLSEAQMKELANALSLVASKPAAWDRIKQKFGTDNPQAFTTGQFADLMDFVGAMPKLTDKLPQAAKDEFLKRITEAGRNHDEVLAALKIDKETLTYGQKSEVAEYMAALKKQEKAA